MKRKVNENYNNVRGNTAPPEHFIGNTSAWRIAWLTEYRARTGAQLSTALDAWAAGETMPLEQSSHATAEALVTQWLKDGVIPNKGIGGLYVMRRLVGDIEKALDAATASHEKRIVDTLVGDLDRDAMRSLV